MSVMKDTQNKVKYPIATFILFALNVAAFIWECVVGEDELAWNFAMYEGAIQDGEWYRGLISCFLHYGFPHLASNMACLLLYGYSLETKIGHKKYLLIYFVAIIGDALLVNFFGKNGLHVGASGAIWGLMTANLVYCLKNHTSPLYAIRGIAMNLAYSFKGGVSWQGHIGGGIAGALIALIVISAVSAPTQDATESCQGEAELR